MKSVHSSIITQTVKDLFIKACTAPPAHVINALEECSHTETSSRGREILAQLIQNAQIAQETGIPYCQDTGMAVLFCKIGQDVHIDGDFSVAVNEGVRRAYTEGYLRKSVLTPLTRINTRDNTPAVIHIELVPGQNIEITVAPKGFGSENMSRLAMLKPSAGVQGVMDFIVESARLAGGNPCPPVVLGVGVGGTFELAPLIAKKQLLRHIGSLNENPELAEIERTCLERINAMGLGPMGVGGKHYCLGVHIAEHPTHLAGLPVAVNFCCHALRHETAVI